MRHLRFAIISMVFTGLISDSSRKMGGEEASFRRRKADGNMRPVKTPGLKYLLLKGIITQDE